MRLAYTPEQEKFRDEIRDYYRQLLTPEMRAAFAGVEQVTGRATATRSGSSARTAG